MNYVLKNPLVNYHEIPEIISIDYFTYCGLIFRKGFRKFGFFPLRPFEFEPINHAAIVLHKLYFL
jgi:hypothetical protein